MPISTELIDKLLQNYHSSQDLLGEIEGLKEMTKRLAKEILKAEINIHLGYARHDAAENYSGNSGNGKTSKNIRS